MANTSFNFLSDSFLMKDDKELLFARTLTEINHELDKYREYIRNHKVELDKECLNEGDESILISDIRAIHYLPQVEEVIKCSLYMNKFILDDPIYSTSYTNIDIINNDRKLRGYSILTDEQLKQDLWEKIEYMRSMLPGVHYETGYVKFYPLSAEPTNDLLNFLNIPDLSFKENFPEAYNWMETKIDVKKVDNNKQLSELNGPCSQLAIMFENDDDFGVFLPAFLKPIFIPGAGYSWQNITPTNKEFDVWKNEEIIKSIRDRYNYIIKKHEYKIKFGAVVSTSSEFENSFLSTVLTEDNDSIDNKVLKVVTQMQMPSLQGLEFNKAMEVRRFFDNEFENFRKKLKEDVLSLRSIKDENELKAFSDELSQKYETELKVISEKVKLKFNLSNIDVIPTGIALVTFLTTPEIISKTTTGIGLLYEVYKGFNKERNEAKQNDCYFLHKLKN